VRPAFVVIVGDPVVTIAGREALMITHPLPPFAPFAVAVLNPAAPPPEPVFVAPAVGVDRLINPAPLPPIPLPPSPPDVPVAASSLPPPPPPAAKVSDDPVIDVAVPAPPLPQAPFTPAEPVPLLPTAPEPPPPPEP
jgi:hypothetical protein